MALELLPTQVQGMKVRLLSDKALYSVAKNYTSLWPQWVQKLPSDALLPQLGQ